MPLWLMLRIQLICPLSWSETGDRGISVWGDILPRFVLNARCIFLHVGQPRLRLMLCPMPP